jgi:peptidoglycan-associated lipoprotein
LVKNNKGVKMKKIALTAGILAFLMFAGCSKQPKLENVKEQNNTATTEVVQADTKVVGEGESVNTQNATLEEQNLEETTITVSKAQNNQQFAKKLASIVVYFDFDKYNIRPDQWPKVEKLANLIKSNPSNYTVRIEGNCDEWGTEEYNYALGLKRANSVKNALIKLGVDPKKLTQGSGKKAWWICEKGHEWEAVIGFRCDKRGVTGCPYCAGRKVCSDNSLAILNPDIASEWHPIKNQPLSPDLVTPGSGKKVWWKCSKGHEWNTSIDSRNKKGRKSYCPYCIGQKTDVNKSIYANYPLLSKQWHPTKNNKLTMFLQTNNVKGATKWLMERYVNVLKNLFNNKSSLKLDNISYIYFNSLENGEELISSSLI